LSAAKNIGPKSWGETPHVRAYPAIGFKKCCMPTGKFDGSDRADFF
jgi:hypothetical protein